MKNSETSKSDNLRHEEIQEIQRRYSERINEEKENSKKQISEVENQLKER